MSGAARAVRPTPVSIVCSRLANARLLEALAPPRVIAGPEAAGPPQVKFTTSSKMAASYNTIPVATKESLEAPEPKKSAKYVIAAVAVAFCFAGAAVATCFKPAAGATQLGVEGGYSWISTSDKINDGWCLDVPGGDEYATKGAKLWLWECGTYNKVWNYEIRGPQYIEYKQSGLCVDCCDDGNLCAVSSDGIGQQLCLWDCNGLANQDWKHDPILSDRSTFYLEQSPGDHLCMDIAGGNWAEGTPIQAWPCSDDPDTYKNQQWHFFGKNP